ncbi:hypothetical protein SKAU_G00370570 [Synaphobranchus kaupii]|uniref:Pentraxin (PTX) domain-containing protein n=1 Tax=Synaphobranchus kaupii TaxID=118154 RepID=A0A9Q1EFY0_SYNKA|nr:hypothetical protein SKAU_G00370570 [Synaphobranchus kaupii]
MASLIFLSVWCVMFLEQCVAEKPSNVLTYSAETDLQGQMFSVNKGGSVTLLSSGVGPLHNFTVCLRHISEESDSKIFFTLSLGGVHGISLKSINTRLQLTVGRDSEAFQSTFPVNVDFTPPWTGLCTTWTSSSGMAQVWPYGMPSVRKGMWRNQVFTGRPLLTISGFVGQVTDVHVWHYILSPSAIASFSNGKVLQEGTVLSWRRAQYNTGGYVVLEPVQVFQRALPCCGFPVGLGYSARKQKANRQMAKKTRRGNSKRRKWVMGKDTEGATAL